MNDRPVAVVTGSAKGIGRGIAGALARSGHRVVLNTRIDAKALARAAREIGDGSIAVRADVTTVAGAKKVIGAALKHWKRVDVLVNTVGDFFPTPAGDIDPDRWEELYSSNVRSALLCTREALPSMRRRKSGVILNIGGTATTSIRGNKTYTAYVMAKTALAVFTKSLAQAEAKHGIRVNLIAPGYIRTYAYTKADIEEMTPAVPAKRLGTPEEVGALAAFLAGPSASYINGAAIDIGGALWV